MKRGWPQPKTDYYMLSNHDSKRKFCYALFAKVSSKGMKKEFSKTLLRQIEEMVFLDQSARKIAGRSKKFDETNIIVYLVDAAHNQKIYKIIKKYGYPSAQIIGKKGMESFWLLIQHQDQDLELQKACLKKCDFAPKEKAYLTDRVLVNQGKNQKYGTQFYRQKNGTLTLRPIKNKRK